MTPFRMLLFRLSVIGAVIFCGVLVTAQNQGNNYPEAATTISKITQQPSRYLNKNVFVLGRIQEEVALKTAGKEHQYSYRIIEPDTEGTSDSPSIIYESDIVLISETSEIRWYSGRLKQDNNGVLILTSRPG
jgi:hypothetical protein